MAHMPAFPDTARAEQRRQNCSASTEAVPRTPVAAKNLTYAYSSYIQLTLLILLQQTQPSIPPRSVNEE